MTKSRRIFAIAAAGCLALALGVGVVGCSSSSSDSSDDSATEESESTEDSNGVTTVNVTLAGTEMSVDVTEVEAGVITFNITNESCPACSEFELLYNGRILNEKENLAPGLDTVSFTATLNGGTYQLYAPGCDEPYIEFTVTGEAAAAPEGSTQDILAQGVSDYAEYVTNQIQYLYDGVVAMDEYIQAGDVENAKIAWAKARAFYEHAESAVDGFLMPEIGDPEDNTTNLDYLIDMRESNLDEDAGWHGFHAIERDLWENGEITDETKALSTELVENCRILNEEVIPTFADGLLPEDLANGAADLLEEVSTNKITGEEDKYSHLDLLDFRANVEGAQQAYACMRDGLNEIDPELVTRIDGEFQDVADLLDTYRDDSDYGYVLYTDELRESDSEKLSEAILNLHDDLSSLAEKVATA